MPSREYLVPIDNHPDLARDVRSLGVINRNTNALVVARQQKKYILDMHKQLEESNTAIAELKVQVQEIRKLLFKEDAAQAS